MPKKLQSRTLKTIEYPYINMEIAIKTPCQRFRRLALTEENGEGLPFRHNEAFTHSPSLHLRN